MKVLRSIRQIDLSDLYVFCMFCLFLFVFDNYYYNITDTKYCFFRYLYLSYCGIDRCAESDTKKNAKEIVLLPDEDRFVSGLMACCTDFVCFIFQ